MWVNAPSIVMAEPLEMHGSRSRQQGGYNWKPPHQDAVKPTRPGSNSRGARHTATLILARRGQLSYGEFLKLSAAGKVGVENSALGAKYDACGLRKVLTLGLSSCKWDPDYR